MPENDSGSDHRKLAKLPLAPTLLAVGTILWRLAGLAERVDFILRVQDQTFAAIFEAFLDYGWVILLAGSVLWPFAAAYLRKNQPAPIERGLKSTWGMVVSVGLLAFLYGVLLTVRATGSVPNVMAAWGPTTTGCQMALDTSRLSTFKDRYYLVGVCGFTDPSTDLLQQTGVTISKPFTITSGGVSIFAPYSATMANTIKGVTPPVALPTNAVTPASGAVQPSSSTTNAAVLSMSMWYQPVLVPKEADISKSASLWDIKKQGGKILNPAYFE